MALRYDFDMGLVTSQDMPDALGNLKLSGANSEMMAMFRDPETVAAIKQADQAVQSFFLESGFALQPFDSGAPPGRFPKRDEAARIRVIERLSENLGQHALEGANWGAFDFPAFMRALGAAQVLDDDSLLAPAVGGARGNPELAAAYAASRKMRGRRMIALGGLITGLILLLFVASQMLP